MFDRDLGWFWEPIQKLTRDHYDRPLLLARQREDGMFECITHENALSSGARQRLARLLGRGWRVVACGHSGYCAQFIEEELAALAEKLREYAPKETDEVAPSSELGREDAVHGGRNASGEVPESPNPFEGGNQPASSESESGDDALNLNESGDVQGEPENAAEPVEAPTDEEPADWEKFVPAVVPIGYGGDEEPRRGGASAYAPTEPEKLSPAARKAARETARVLMRIIGIRAEIDRLGVDFVELAWRARRGIDPKPALERPSASQRAKILMTPDVSGSCQDFSPVWQAVGIEIQKMLGGAGDVLYVENINGALSRDDEIIPEDEVTEILRDVDVVLYAGDADGYSTTVELAQRGAIVVVFDNYRASELPAPRVAQGRTTLWGNKFPATGRFGRGARIWVVGVHARRPETWVKAAELAAGYPV